MKNNRPLYAFKRTKEFYTTSILLEFGFLNVVLHSKCNNMINKTFLFMFKWLRRLFEDAHATFAF